jgi:hypothetical protein
LSKFFVTNLAFVFVLTVASSGLAVADPATSSAPDSAQVDQSAAAAPATTPAPAPAPAKAAKKQPLPTDIICKPDSGTGGRLGGPKICMTRADWRKRELNEE